MKLSELDAAMELISDTSGITDDTEIFMRIHDSAIPLKNVRVVTTIVDGESRTEIFFAGEYAKF